MDRPKPLSGLRVLLVFQAFKTDSDSLAFVKNVRHLGVVPPLNLLYISAHLKSLGAGVEVLECSSLNIDEHAAVRRARAKTFDFVLFTVTNLDFLFAIRWIRAFHAAFGKPVIVGGTAAENYPAEIAAVPEVTAAVHGPAELCLGDLLRTYAEGGAWWETPGVAAERDGKVVVNRARPYTKALRRGLPDRGALDTQAYYSILSRERPFTPALAAFGCPFGCEFCQIRRTTYIPRAVEDLVDELEVCQKEFGIGEVDYFDMGFTTPRARVFALRDAYKKRGLTIRWSCRARTDQVDPEVLAAMADAGCTWIGYGIESFAPEVLGAIGKKLGRPDEILRALRWTRDAGLRAVGFFVFGLPGETAATLEHTGRFLQEAPLDFAQISPYWPVPHTPVYERMLRAGGVDLWREAIVHGARQADFKLEGTDFTVHDMHRAVSKAYREFYFRPRQIAHMLAGAASLSQLRNYASAGLDLLGAAVRR